MRWKAIDRYSQDYLELQTKDKVKFYKTPDAILQRQLEVWDEVVEKKAAENPLFKEMLDSQIAFAKRATRGSRTPWSTAGWRSTTTSARTRAARSSEAIPSLPGRRSGAIDRMAPRGPSSRRADGRLPPMNVQSFLHTVDGISTWVGKAAAWLIIALMGLVCVEVVQALRPEHADGVDLRRQQHDLRHAVHAGRRLHAGPGRAMCAATSSTAP